MQHGSVVYVHRVRCPSCGLVFAGYLDNLGDGTGAVNCPKCETRVVQALPQHYVEQIPLPGHESLGHQRLRASHHPGLYSQPKHPPRLDLNDLVRVAYRPVKAFESLYLSTNLQRGLSLVVLFSLASAMAGTLVTAGAGELFGYDTRDALVLGLRGFASWIVTMLAFLVFAVVAAVVAKGIYGGRGERGATIMLVGYCFPAYVVVNLLLLVVFAAGFQGLDINDVTSWGAAAEEQALVASAILLAVALACLTWLLWIVSRAIGVANDISGSESVLTAIIASIAAGLVYVIAGAAFRLPIGLSP
jgi:hypothetical protein